MKSPKHLPLMVLACTIAILIKFAVHENEQISERIIEAPVTYQHPSGTDMMSYDQVETVKVGVQGLSNQIAALSVFTVEVAVGLPPDALGTTEITLDAGNVIFRTPGDFEVLSIEPNRFTLQVEPRLEMTVPVRAEPFGEPAAGAQVGKTQVRPSWAEVSGPESLVRGVAQLTAKVSLDGHARTFEEWVTVTSPDPLIQVQPGRVLVIVPMQEPSLSIDLENTGPTQETPSSP